MKTFAVLLSVFVAALLAFFSFLPPDLPSGTATVAPPVQLEEAPTDAPFDLWAARCGADTVATLPQPNFITPVSAQVPKVFLPILPLAGMNLLTRQVRKVLRRSTARMCPLVLRCFQDHPHHAPPALA